MFKCLDSNVQTYIREAVNKLDVKCYELSLTTEDHSYVFYFCNRVEFGIGSVYYDKEGVNLSPNQNSPDIILYTPRKEKLTEEVIKDIHSKIKEYLVQPDLPVFKATIKVSKMDPLEKDYVNNNDSDFNRDISIAYLKVINVPDGTDLDYSASEPNKNHLILDYIDNVSYEIEETELENEKDRLKMAKVEKLYQAIKSIHVHLEISEVTIYTGEHSRRDLFSAFLRRFWEIGLKVK